jgi:hypothetical protein
MIPFPKPRSFWDYALFALMLAGLLVCFFWVQAGYRIGWGDAAFGLLAAVLCTLAIGILARSSEKTKRIMRSTWQAKLLLIMGTLLLLFGSLYANLYFIHHISITGSRLRHDVWLGIALCVAMFWSYRSGIAAGRRHLH